MSPGQQLSQSNLPPQLAEQLQADLAKGQRLVWVGRPTPESLRHDEAVFQRMTRVMLAICIIGPLLLAASVAWFVFEGLWAVFAFCFFLPFLMFPSVFGVITFRGMLRRGAPATWRYYFLTDRRALVGQCIPGGATWLDSYSPEALTAMVCREGTDGSGSLVFREETEELPEDGFLNIAAVRDVERVLRQTLLSGPGGPAASA
jgi:hypothetical protein